MFNIVIVERKLAIASSVVVGDDETGLAIQLIGHDGLLHIDVDGATASQVVDDKDQELLSPAEAAPEGVCLGYNQLSILVGGVYDGHALLLNPYLTELTDASGRCLFVEGVEQVIPSSLFVGLVAQKGT